MRVCLRCVRGGVRGACVARPALRATSFADIMLVSTLPRLPLPSDSLVATPSPFDELLIGEDKEAPIPQEADVEVRVNEDVTETKSYNCTYAGCNKVFRNSSKLSRHFRTHTGEVRVSTIILTSIYSNFAEFFMFFYSVNSPLRQRLNAN